MKEIRELHLSEFQKEIINKLDDKYFYKINGNGSAMCIYKTEKNKHLITITDDSKSETINVGLEILKNRNEESLNRHFKLVKENEEIIKLLELILEENK